MSLGTVGSVEAAYLAVNKGWAINLSGGFHHATKYGGGGFCIYPDISFITYKLRQIYNIQKIMVVDLDAHQGNGHERDHKNDPNIFTLDAYNHGIYPGDRYAREGIDCDMKVYYSMND